MDGKGIVIGRFWVGGRGDRYNESEPVIPEFFWSFGDLYIINGRWPVLGTEPVGGFGNSPEFCFVRGNDLARSWISTYDATCKLIDEVRIVDRPLPVLPRDALMGAGFVEARLKQILNGERTPFD